jgi:Flp pilus assembly protein TadD
MGFNGAAQFDSALVYAQKLMHIDPANERAYLVAGASSFRLGDKARAKIYLIRYLEMNPQGPEKLTAIELLNQLR